MFAGTAYTETSANCVCGREGSPWCKGSMVVGGGPTALRCEPTTTPCFCAADVVAPLHPARGPVVNLFVSPRVGVRVRLPTEAGEREATRVCLWVEAADAWDELPSPDSPGKPLPSSAVSVAAEVWVVVVGAVEPYEGDEVTPINLPGVAVACVDRPCPTPTEVAASGGVLPTAEEEVVVDFVVRVVPGGAIDAADASSPTASVRMHTTLVTGGSRKGGCPCGGAACAEPVEWAPNATRCAAPAGSAGAGGTNGECVCTGGADTGAPPSSGGCLDPLGGEGGEGGGSMTATGVATSSGGQPAPEGTWPKDDGLSSGLPPVLPPTPMYVLACGLVAVPWAAALLGGRK